MADVAAAVLALNRGKISKLALARVDLTRMAYSAQDHSNAFPRVLGSMSFRPGFKYLFNTASDGAARYIPFIFSTTDVAEAEVTATGIRFVVDDAIITRGSVSSAVANGSFTTDLTSWTDADESGATSSWVSGSYLSLVGTIFNAAIRRQTVSVSAGDANTEHGVTFTIQRGPVTIKIGSTSGGSEYSGERELKTGTYSFAFTPTGDFFIELASRAQAASLVASVAVDSSGDLTLPSPYTATDLDLLRWDQSADVMFIACSGFQQRRLERFDLSSKSWGISLYEPDDGPFRDINTSSITLTPSALTGDITLTASRALFSSSNVGGLFNITSIGQKVSSSLTAQNQFSDHIRVIGVDNSRIFELTISGTWSATVTLQRSVGEPGSWADVTDYTTNQAAIPFDDGLDNQIIYYRIGIKTGDFSSGTAVVTLDYSAGGLLGIARVTGFTSTTVVDAAVLQPFGATTASADWAEGHWSIARGYPSAVAFYEGRLWWMGKGFFFASASDGFDVFDETIEGDRAPFVRSIGSGPIDAGNWLLPLQRLIGGTAGAEISIRSTSLDEPLTADNFNIKDASTQGSAAVNPVKIDKTGIFVQRNGTRIFEETFSLDGNDYRPTDLTDIIPEICEPGVTRMAVARQPDTRVFAVKSDGTVAVLLREPDNEVLAWLDVTTDGLIEDITVLPGTIEDSVYFTVARTINGSTVRFHEKMALESECVGGTLNKQADAYIQFTQAPSSTVSGLTHLIAESVVVWADGKCLDDANGDIATFTVNGSGEITLTDGGSAYEATTGIVGLAYQARWKGTKLSYGSELGTALNQRKRVSHLGLVLSNTHHKGVKYGPTFDDMDDLPQVLEGAVVTDDTIHESYDHDMTEFISRWGADPRICLEMNAPRPATILGISIGMSERDKS